MNRKTLLTIIIGAAITFLAAAAAWNYFGDRKDSTGLKTNVETERKILYWTDPMIPGFRSDKPGKSPMNMDMVPVYENASGASDASSVSIHPSVINNLGVRTYRVARGGITRTLAVQGYLFREGGKLFVLADIFDRGAAWLRTGLAAEIQIPDLPSRAWDGVVESLKSDVDIGTRSLRTRIRILKPDAALATNMFANVTIKSAAQNDRKIMVPREALIRTGQRTAVVLALGDGRFHPVDVVPGEEAGDWVEIREGVKEGDSVVVSGQFLIDSEASVRASFQRMDAEAGNNP